MKRRLLLTISFFLVCVGPSSVFAAGESTWFVPETIHTGFTPNQFIVRSPVIEVDPDGCGPTFQNEFILLPTDQNYDDDKTLLESALLAGREVKINFSGCDSGRKLVTVVAMR